MKYIEFLNTTIKDLVLTKDKIVLFGQNIAAGSCISGLTKGLQVKTGNLIINTPNCENTLCGVGFGSMMHGVSAVFFMKQLDFLLLGIDQLTNTYNIVRRKAPKASFTIFPVVVDSGYEGPQASLNNLGDFCSIANIQGFSLTNQCDIREILEKHLVTPGFRIIAASQRLFKTEIIPIQEMIYVNPERTVFQYTDGPAASIVCFNFSFPHGLELNKRLQDRGIRTSLFSVNTATPTAWERIVESAQQTRKLVLIDDSKSTNVPWQALLQDIFERVRLENKIIIRRDLSGYYPRPHADQLFIDYEAVINRLLTESCVPKEFFYNIDSGKR